MSPPFFKNNTASKMIPTGIKPWINAPVEALVCTSERLKNI
ncbi:MAG: hypothetical protein WDO16_17075 [Bacteroidota bacterium]